MNLILYLQSKDKTLNDAMEEARLRSEDRHELRWREQKGLSDGVRALNGEARDRERERERACS